MIDHARSVLVAWESALWLLALASAIMLIASMVLIPFLLVRLPPEYFQRPARNASSGGSRVARIGLVVVRNCLGLVLLAAGILMLFLPGQGLLTIAAAIVVLDFPGKRAVEHWIATRPAIFAAANRIRRWRGHPPFTPPRRR